MFVVTAEVHKKRKKSPIREDVSAIAVQRQQTYVMRARFRRNGSMRFIKSALRSSPLPNRDSVDGSGVGSGDGSGVAVSSRNS